MSALRVVALRDEDFGRILSAAVLLVAVGTPSSRSAPAGASSTALRRGRDDDHLQRPRSQADVTDPWLKVFTAFYVLVGIGILVEVARRLGMAFVAARAEIAEAKRAKDGRGDGGPRPRGPG